MPEKQKLSRRATNLIEAFGEAAKEHGWQQDCGVGASVDAAKEDYEKTKRSLERYIKLLEAKL